MKIILIIPDGVSLRNYFYSNFIDELNINDIEIILFHNVSENAILEVKSLYPFIKEIFKIPDFFETLFQKFLRESLCYARILKNVKIFKNKTILHFWGKNPVDFKMKLFYFSTEFFGLLLSKSNTAIIFCDRLYEKQIKKNLICKQLEIQIQIIKPDLVLNLHQRAISSSPVIETSKKINIKTATVIFSWDNIPKARLVSKHDYYFVWSELMKNELLLSYPEINEKQIKIVGSPQFEFYFKKENFTSKNDFFATFGLNPNKKTICFSANDLSSPNEAIYLRDICEEILKIDELNRPQILFRRCPVDFSDRFDFVLKKYKGLVFAVEPIWEYSKNFNEIYPTLNDNYILANTVKHSDIVINLGSTMAFDFAIFNKPCLYLNYNPNKKLDFDVKQVFQFQHFKSMQNLECVEWINFKSDLKSKILYALKSPQKIGTDKLKWFQTICLFPLKLNSKKIVQEIIKL